jgi:hypothetical protein
MTISLLDAWLSGFTDAERCFNVSLTQNINYLTGFVIKLRFILDQKDHIILTTIRALFNFGAVTLRYNTEGVYRYTSTGFKRMVAIRAYFTAFPLKTHKLESFTL